uniref:Uncharacterized protein MANES_01G012400 n=1 Tax=Rhizophora mucronata TaxID=61149 RepID=A0A2P2IH97_RHIMU
MVNTSVVHIIPDLRQLRRVSSRVIWVNPGNFSLG